VQRRAFGNCKHFFLNIHQFVYIHGNSLGPSRKLKSMLDLLLLQQKSRRITKDVRARKGPECFTDHYMVKRKII
jgi:hypothetical protein